MWNIASSENARNPSTLFSVFPRFFIFTLFGPPAALHAESAEAHFLAEYAKMSQDFFKKIFAPGRRSLKQSPETNARTDSGTNSSDSRADCARFGSAGNEPATAGEFAASIRIRRAIW